MQSSSPLPENSLTTHTENDGKSMHFDDCNFTLNFLLAIPVDIFIEIINYISFRDRAKLEQIDKSTKVFCSNYSYSFWMTSKEICKVEPKILFKEKLEQLTPILQRYFLNSNFSADIAEHLFELLLKKNYNEALIYLGIHNEEQITEIDKRGGTGLTRFSDYGFYILANKLIPYDEIMKVEYKKYCANSPAVSTLGCFASENGVRALEKKLFTNSQLQYFTLFCFILMSKDTLDLIESGFITTDQLFIACPGNTIPQIKSPRHLIGIILDKFRNDALHKTFTDMQETEYKERVRILLTKNSIIALENGLITPEQVTAFTSDNLRILLSEGFDALSNHLISVNERGPEEEPARGNVVH